MKPRDAAALALVGWYLLIPPFSRSGQLQEFRPLDDWVYVDSFDTATECREATLQAVVQLESEASSNSRIQAYGASRCIATDDPRLKEKSVLRFPTTVGQHGLLP